MRTKEPVDERVLDKIRSVYKAGVQQEKDIRNLVAEYVKDELFAGKPVPPAIFRRYNPTHKDIANEITKVCMHIVSTKYLSIRLLSLNNYH